MSEKINKHKKCIMAPLSAQHCSGPEIHMLDTENVLDAEEVIV